MRLIKLQRMTLTYIFGTGVLIFLFFFPPIVPFLCHGAGFFFWVGVKTKKIVLQVTPPQKKTDFIFIVIDLNKTVEWIHICIK